jgi:serine/threonine protein kinase
MFEITSLYPLFPGSNETDQITRIHKVLGTPSQEMLQKFKSKGASHISFDFPQFKGVSLPQLIPHAAGDAVDLLVKLLKYDASERITAREAMKHPYFKETRDAEAKKEGAKEEKSVGTATLNSVSGGSNVQSNHKSPNKDNNHGNQYNLQSSTNKALPNITGLQGSSVNFEGSGGIKQQQYSSSNELYQQNQPVVFKSNHSNQKHHVASNNSSLPPISQQTQQKNQFLEQKSSRSLQPQPNSQQNSQGLSNTQKKKKKYRMNYGQKSGQQTEQVMKAYGVPKSIGGFESSSKILTSDTGNKNMVQNSYSGHPNRHYVQAGKK